LHLIRKSDLLVGLCAGSATALASSMVILLLGLVPAQPVRAFFGSWYGHPLWGWIAGGFLSPFWGLTTRTQVYLPGPSGQPVEVMQTMHGVAASFGGLLVFLTVLFFVGRTVRRRVAGRRRLATLVVAALAVAVIAATAAALLGHHIPQVETGSWITYGGRLSYDALTYFFGALVP
jgi:hypothetical protein